MSCILCIIHLKICLSGWTFSFPQGPIKLPPFKSTHLMLISPKLNRLARRSPVTILLPDIGRFDVIVAVKEVSIGFAVRRAYSVMCMSLSTEFVNSGHGAFFKLGLDLEHILYILTRIITVSVKWCIRHSVLEGTFWTDRPTG